MSSAKYEKVKSEMVSDMRESRQDFEKRQIAEKNNGNSVEKGRNGLRRMRKFAGVG